MTLMYITFGENTDYYLQAHLSILTFLRQLKEDDRIVVVTDRPERYRRFTSHVKVVVMTTQQMKAWSGEHCYLFRVKTMAICHVCRLFPNDHFVMLDSDTFLAGSLDDLRRCLDDGHGVMHCCEGHPSQMRHSSLRMWRQIGGRRFAGVTLGPKHEMWNSGVVGVPGGRQVDVCELTLRLLDELLDSGVTCFNVEQYAQSIAMLELLPDVVPADKWVSHYWGNKRGWDLVLKHFVTNAYLQSLTVEQQAVTIDMDALRSIPLCVRQSNTARRLHNFIDWIFK